ncbi:SRPBCC family protein [Conexibacter sp. DBS9H8]|uniref:SRPBCC family protein n=1 Tax=Conexibacter sp. DBS9H8 TaxID=2937801 RepID=UPI00200BE7EE|nr:SRPBCC family protein [Conexibacter sp. DBS9H8]
MGKVTARASTTVHADPDTVIGLLRDYGARPRILTDNYSAFRVEPGDVLSFHFAAGGRERDYRLVSELTGHRLTEKDELSSFTNVWEVTPAAGGSTVTLTGSWDGAGGIPGIFEGLFAPLGLKRIYAEVLTKLSAALPG